MTLAVGGLNLVLGFVYTSYGVMTILDMKRGWRDSGFSHFGLAWILMAFTCGPHHWVHGGHLLFEGRPAGGLDLVAVLVGFPAGVAWFLLRIEAFRGGRGDRFVRDTPGWIHAIPLLCVAYATALLAAVLPLLEMLSLPRAVAPNLMLIAVYSAIGWFIFRTQLRNRAPLGGWSLSGLCLTLIFPTCAFMHGVFALYAARGLYRSDLHLAAIDWLAVPAALYFLWVVRSLYHGTLRDWNRVRQPPVPAVAAGGGGGGGG